MSILTALATALRRVLDAMLVALILVVLAGVGLGKLVPLTGHDTLVVGGGSMEPTIPKGAAIVLAPVDPGTLVAGDVVSLRAGPGRQVFTHRILRVAVGPTGRSFDTKGDANDAPDPTLVPADAVLGRVVLTIPLAGYLLTLLSLPLGVLFVIGVACTLLAATWLLEVLEDRGLRRRRRILRRLRTERLLVAGDGPAAGRPLWASETGAAVAGRLAGARSAIRTTPTAEGWRPAGIRSSRRPRR
jgi:signal peptidase I